MQEKSLSIRNLTKSRLGVSRAAYLHMKNEVLGNKYDLSLVFVGNATSRKLNKTYRSKNKPTNVLSFSLAKNEGEIIMDLSKIKSEIKLFNRTFNNLIAYLFIHGLFHLKGARHSSTMERKEAAIRRKFKI